MTYNPAIPLGTDKPATSQPQILTNFGQLNTIFSRNHYAFNDATAANRGKHQFCSFVNQAAGPVTTATEGALYCKLQGGRSGLYFRRESSGTEILMSNQHSPSWTVVGTTGTGRTFLPGNLLIQYGYLFVDSTTSTVVTYPTAFSAVPYSIQVSMERAANPSDHQVYIIEASSAVNQFRVYQTAVGSHYVYWMAIGPS
jgi:hypothetical protein